MIALQSLADDLATEAGVPYADMLQAMRLALRGIPEPLAEYGYAMTYDDDGACGLSTLR